MTPLESSLYVALIAPVLALIVGLFLKQPLAFKWSSLLLALSGLGGIMAGGYGAIAEAPFTMVTPAFYGMTIALDRFSAIFFFGISIVLFAVGLYALRYGKTHESEHTALRLVSVASAVLVIGAQWVMLAGNIVGFIAAWAVMMLAMFALTMSRASSNGVKIPLRAFAVAQCSTAAVTAGFFTLTSGALFSDFGTLAYLADQGSPTAIAMGCGLLLVGFALAIGLAPLHRWFVQVLSAVPSHISALFRGTLSGVALYAFIRCILFILPPLSLWFVLPVLILGVLSMVVGALCATRELRLSPFIAYLSLQNFGVTALMVGGAMAFQALAQYDAMNVMLFAAFIQMTMHAIATSGLFFVRDAVAAGNETLSDLGGIAPRAPKLAIASGVLLAGAIGAPPFATMTSAWMFATTLGTIFHDIDRPFALTAVAILVVFILCRLASIFAAVRWYIGVFLGSARSSSAEAVQEPSDVQLVPIVFLALATLLSGFALPQLMLAIGADPLTDAAGTFQGGIVSAEWTLRMGIVGVAVAGVLLVLWHFRASWIDRIPSFEAVEALRHRFESKITIGNTCKALWNRALEKLRR